MHHISIYGAGHLASSLLKGLRDITEHPIVLYNRNPARAVELISLYPNLKIASNYLELVEYSSFVFIIIPPAAITQLDPVFIDKIISTNSVIVSCANYLTIDNLSSLYSNTKIIRLLPNILWQIKQGVSIYSSNPVITKKDINDFLEILSPITTLIKADNETDFDKFGKLTSCGPGLFSNLLDQLFVSFNINSEEQKKVILKTLTATIEYSLTTRKNLKDVIIEVANKDGLTESGINSMNAFLPDNFSAISLAMDKKLSDKKSSLKPI